MHRPEAHSFRDLEVWQLSHELVIATYGLTNLLPRNEEYGLKSPMRRAAVSIRANIAEEFRRRSWADKARFLNIAQGSLEELRYYTILGPALGYFAAGAVDPLLARVTGTLEAAEYVCWKKAQVQELR